MENYLEKANAQLSSIIELRRQFHQFAETGFQLDKTTDLVKKTLVSYGLTPAQVGKAGISATIGSGEPVILLRADMDALPMQEETGLSFAAGNGNCHSCGHDSHTAMLLGAAKLLKDNESALKGTVKLMFQPAEELLAGALDMIENGILENPQVDAALGLHIQTGLEHSSAGSITYAKGPALYSGDAVTISITGRDAHGSMPYKGVDAITIAAHIILASQEIIAREIPCDENAVILVGKMSGGTTCNTVAGTAILEASVRAQSKTMRNFLKNRIKEVAEQVAQTYRGQADVQFVYGMPPLINNPELTDEFVGYGKSLLGEKQFIETGTQHGTEDFTAIAERVPAVMLYLGVGSINEGYEYCVHHPKMHINEQALAKGSALYAHCAHQYLEHHGSK